MDYTNSLSALTDSTTTVHAGEAFVVGFVLVFSWMAFGFCLRLTRFIGHHGSPD